MSGREVITFDIPGVGHSALPSRPYRLRGIARLAAAVLDHFGHARADVLGCLMGRRGGPAVRAQLRIALPSPRAVRHCGRCRDAARAPVGGC